MDGRYHPRSVDHERPQGTPVHTAAGHAFRSRKPPSGELDVDGAPVHSGRYQLHAPPQQPYRPTPQPQQPTQPYRHTGPQYALTQGRAAAQPQHTPPQRMLVPSRRGVPAGMMTPGMSPIPHSALSDSPITPGPRRSSGDPAEDVVLLQHELMQARKELASLNMQVDARERKLSASLLSIKLFWGPELDKERRLRMAERNRADNAETLLKEQLEKGASYMQKLSTLQIAYEELEESVAQQSDMESQLRATLEEQIQELTAQLDEQELAMARMAEQYAANEANSQAAAAPSRLTDSPEFKLKMRRKETELKRKETEIASLKDHVADLEQQLEEWQEIAGGAGTNTTTPQPDPELERELQEHRELVRKLKMDLESNNTKLRQAQEAAEENAGQKHLIETLSSELESHRTEVEGLQRQLKKAQKKAEEQQSESSVLVTRSEQQAKRQADALQAKLDAAARSRREVEDELRQVQQLLDAQKELTANKENDISVANKHSQSLQEKIEDLERELVGKRDELDVFARREGELLPLRDQVAELKSSISARESQVLELERQLTGARERAEGQLEELRRTVAHKDEKILQLTQAAEESRQLSKMNDELRASIGKKEDELADLRTKLGELAKLNADVKILHESVADREQQLRKAEDALQAQAEKHSGELEQLRSALSSKENELESARTRLEKIPVLEDRLEHLNVSLASRDAEITELRKAQVSLAKLEGEVSELRVSLAKKDAEIAELRQEHSGTASRLSMQSEEQAVAIAARDGEIRELRKQLDAAKRFEEKTEALGVVVATKEGEISELKKQLHELSMVEKEAASLRAAVSKKSVELEQLASRADEDAKTLHAQLAELNRDIRERDSTISELKMAMTGTSAELSENIKSLERTVDEKEAEILRLQEQSKANAEKLANASRTWEAQLGQKDKEAADARAQHQQRLEEAREEQNQLRARAKELEERLAERAAELSSHTSDLERLRSSMGTATKQAERDREALEGRMKKHEALIGELEEKNTELQKTLQAREADNARMKKSLSTAEKKATSLDMERAQLLAELDGQSEGLSDLQAKSQQYSAQLAAAQDDIVRLRKALDDKDKIIEEMMRKARDQEEQIINERTNTLLGLVSEKDSKIAALEMAGAKKNKKEIESLLAARAVDVKALKEQFDKRAALLAANATDRSMDRSREAESRDELLERMELRDVDSRRLRTYIDQLLAEVLRQDDSVATAIMTGLPRLQQEAGVPAEPESLSDSELHTVVKRLEKDNNNLESYVDQLLQRIAEHKPSILEYANFAN